ncbi:hypothetical protein BOTBODRAFT_27952 [Botryobasidium botryosum FD-172 SS1]|uniref:Phospholipase/carboxylesterase/thioesterase domain-containing protein n=1 Tax=Botryobasidium botryosum (strain FD-172 SS1) TaxID=930990 RepID=A0A067MUG7_BOTB1|nr:hypothetical protein BOTBODRAFT_27952 [Botryobasidium botryosum FD-172 SS1]
MVSAPEHIDLVVGEAASPSTTSPRTKPVPQAPGIPVPFSYAASDDGTDENLLILLHGLGDTHLHFAKLGRQLRLPQTATLALRAPERIPFLYDEEAFQWYESFDALGELLTRPNPTPALDLLGKVLAYLIRECSWSARQIHLFGFAQGGSVAAELGVRWWREHASDAEPGSVALGSVVSVEGPLLSHPTLAQPSPTPVLVFHHTAAQLPPAALGSYRKGYGAVREAEVRGSGGMPRSKEDWQEIMRFWSEVLGRRQAGDLYEVLSGGPSQQKFQN